MEKFLANYEDLAMFIDALLSKKYPTTPPEQLKSIREESIRKLDDHIGTAVFGSLTKAQADQIEQILDSGEENPQVFQDFFRNAGIDLEQTIEAAMTNFGRQFLEDQNGRV